MSRNDVRLAIANYLTEANITYVGTVYPARAYILEQDYEQNATYFYTASLDGSGCVLVVNLPSDDRRRRALTGRGAVNDSDVYPATIELFFADVSGDPVQAQMDYDAVVESIFTAIRADATLGTSGGIGGWPGIWSAGEYGGLKHHQSEPWCQEEGGTVFFYGVVEVETWEWYVGNV